MLNFDLLSLCTNFVKICWYLYFMIKLLHFSLKLLHRQHVKTSLHKICENIDFRWSDFSRIKTESTILSLYWGIWVNENPYSRIYYAVCKIGNLCWKGKLWQTGNRMLAYSEDNQEYVYWGIYFKFLKILVTGGSVDFFVLWFDGSMDTLDFLGA